MHRGNTILSLLFIAILVGAFFVFYLPIFEKFQSQKPPPSYGPIEFETSLPKKTLPKEESPKDTSQVRSPTAEDVKEILDEISKLRQSLQTIREPQTDEPAVKSGDIYARALKALVNIFCDDTKNNVYILGSGAIIHPAGYVLTNGHLAENFAKPQVECILRSGSPAKPFAKAKILWLPEQTSKIGETEIPKRDMAILKITEIIKGGEALGKLDFFEIDPLYQVKEGEVLYSLSYPTEFLGVEIILKDTTILFSLGAISNLLTIDDNTSDAEGAYLKGEISAQHGSSGGIFLETRRGRAVGLFVGLTEGKTTSERKQFMFLSSYIDEILRQEKGLGLKEFLDSNP